MNKYQKSTAPTQAARIKADAQRVAAMRSKLKNAKGKR